MKRLASILAAGLTLGLTACSSGDTVNTTSCQARAFNVTSPPVVPPCTVPVNLVVDDSVNKVYLSGEMQWKGSFQFDAVTRIAYHDGSWNGGNGPFAPLYDDGPWDGWSDTSVSPPVTRYGHEPRGAIAGDHILGITVFAPNTGTADVTYEYGLIDHAFGDGWVWYGSQNGNFKVLPGATTPVTAPGQTMRPFATTDLKLTLDKAQLPTTCGAAACDWGTSTVVQVKGSAWGWVDIPIFDDGTRGDDAAADGVYTFVLSEFAGAGKQLYHSGLAATGDTAQFIFAFGPGHLGDATYKEYKVSSIPPMDGVAAYSKAAGAGTWTALTPQNQATGDKNTYVTIP